MSVSSDASSSIQLVFPDGSIREYPCGTTAIDVVRSIGSRLAKAALAVQLDDTMLDLGTSLTRGGQFRVHTFDTPEGREVYRHSTAHLMAQAVKELFPESRLAVGPALVDSFYYDFDVGRSFTPEDLVAVEARMEEIAKRDLPVARRELSRDDALRFFAERGEIFKVELVQELPDNEPISLYTQGEFADLCRGPHVSSTGRLRNFKLLSVAGAYWRADEKNQQLQRLYGTSFDKKEDLELHLHRIEEAKKRDHRKLGRELGLFSTHEDAGGGLIYWHPKGARVRSIIEDWWRREHFKVGYDVLYSPHIGRSVLWETSGHLDHYRENMYAPMEIEGQQFYLKPMNCPFHIKIYQTGLHSYRDLPLRWAELGTVYRYEKSGVLHGMLRVRGFTQDDAHIFCTPEQVEAEIVEVLRFSLFVWRTLGFDKIKAYLATRPEKSVGEEARWQQAQESLLRAIEKEGLPYELDEGGGAFYGPKIDLKVEDALGREWQMSTIQFDFNLPERFDLSYVGEDGQRHRPYMIHRALLGSLERFFGILIEHYAGNFPVWLAPTQVAVLPISADEVEYASEVAADLRRAEFRVKLDVGNDRMNAKIRNAEIEKIPYMMVVGRREREQRTVALRRHGTGDLGAFSVADAIARLQEDVDAKR